MFLASWVFSLSEIRVPVAVWHGGKDNSITPMMGKHIAATIPGAQLHLLPNESHLVFLSRWREMLVDLLARGRATGAEAMAQEASDTFNMRPVPSLRARAYRLR